MEVNGQLYFVALLLLYVLEKTRICLLPPETEPRFLVRPFRGPLTTQVIALSFHTFFSN